MSVRLESGGMLEVIPRLVAEGVVCDAVVTDPPYGLEFMGQEWDAPWRRDWQAGGHFSKPGIGDRPTPWPSFSATSPFGTINPTCGECGGRLRGARKCGCTEPRWKPIGKRRNQENENLPNDVTSSGKSRQMTVYQGWCEAWAREVYTILRPGGFLVAFGGTRTYHRLVCAIEDAGFVIQDTIAWLYGSGFPKRRNMLKPAFEPIVLAYKPGGKRTMQVDECRIGTSNKLSGGGRGPMSPVSEGWDRPNRHNPAVAEFYKQRSAERTAKAEALGRWPANVCHDGSEEVTEAFPNSLGSHDQCPSESSNSWFTRAGKYNGVGNNDTGSAARYFYCAKADKQDRWGSSHPTVKPVELMKWLVALVTPPGGLVLDPFAGSGTTGVAAFATGRNAILIEREDQYIADIRERLAFYEGSGTHSVQAKNRNRQSAEAGPLFAQAFDPALDAALSYDAAIKAIGERVKAGELLPTDGYFGDSK